MTPDPLADHRLVLATLRRSMLDPALSGAVRSSATCSRSWPTIRGRRSSCWPRRRGRSPAAAVGGARARGERRPAAPLARAICQAATRRSTPRSRMRSARRSGDREKLRCCSGTPTSATRRAASPVSAIALAEATKDWPLTSGRTSTWARASGLGLLLGEVAVQAGGAHRAGARRPRARRRPARRAHRSARARGAADRARGRHRPRSARPARSGVPLVDACVPVHLPVEWAVFDRAIDLVLERRQHRARLRDRSPAAHRARHGAGQPLVVTDTYVAVFMSEDAREKLRRELDAIAADRPVVWLSNDPAVPIGRDPDRTAAGVPDPAPRWSCARTRRCSGWCRSRRGRAACARRASSASRTPAGSGSSGTGDAPARSAGGPPSGALRS